MTDASSETDISQRRDAIFELVARFIVANDAERERILLDYPVLRSPIGQLSLGQFESSVGPDFPDRGREAIKRLRSTASKRAAETSRAKLPRSHVDPSSKAKKLSSGELINLSLVTNGEYARFVTETGYPPTTFRPMLFATPQCEPEQFTRIQALVGELKPLGFNVAVAQKSASAPVVEINWFDATEYARWVGRSLPTAELWDEAFNTLKNLLWSRLQGDRAQLQEWTKSRILRGKERQFVIRRGAHGECSQPPQAMLANLGFRCCQRVAKFSLEQLTAEIREAEIQRQMRINLRWDAKDDLTPVALFVLEAARKVASGEFELTKVAEQFEGALKERPQEARELITKLCKYVVRRTTEFPRPNESLSLLHAAAQLTVSIASTLRDEEIGIQAQLALGEVFLYGRDDDHAQPIFESCIAYFERTGALDKLARVLLSLGQVHMVGNLKFNENPVGSKNALKCFGRSLELFDQLGLARERQEAESGIASVLLRLGLSELGFWEARHALADSAELEHPRDQIVGMLRAGEALINGKFREHAVYVHKLAHELASHLGDLELINEARLKLCMCHLNDVQGLATHAAKAVEAGVWLLDSRCLNYTTNLIYGSSPDSHLAWAVDHFLTLLTDAAAKVTEFNLPLLRLVEIATSRSLMPALPLEEIWYEIEEALPGDLDEREAIFVDFTRALALLPSDPEKAHAIMLNASKASRSLGDSDLQATASLIDLCTLKELSDWASAESELRNLKDHLNLDEATRASFLGYEAEIWFFAGRPTASLAAADDASIECVNISNNITAANVSAEQSLLRSRLFSYLGSPQAFPYAMSATWSFTRASNGFGQIESNLREAQTCIETSEFELAAKRIESARSMLYAPDAREHPRLQAELEYTIAVLNYAARDLPTAAPQFERVAIQFRSLKLLEPEIRASIKLAAVKTELGEHETAYEQMEALLPSIRRRRHPFEIIDACTVIGHLGLRRGDLGTARRSFQEAISHYWAVRDGIDNNPPLRKTWLRRQRHLFEHLINDVLLPQGDVTGAWRTAQETKGASLQDLLQESEFGFSTAENSKIREQWIQIRNLESQLEEASNFAGGEDDETKIRIELRSLRKEFDNSVASVHKTGVHELTRDSSNLQDWLTDSKTAIVDFFVAEKLISAFLLLPGASDPQVFRLGATSDLPTQSPYRRPDGTVRALQKELFRKLFGTTSDGEGLVAAIRSAGVRRIVFVPSGVLSLFPLHAAADPMTEACLLDEFDSICFVPSLEILHKCLHRTRPSLNRLVAIEDPSGTLPSAPLEIDSISSLFSDSVVLRNSKATRQGIVEAGQAGALHFACHGTFQSSNPLASSLKLADKGLTLAEIYNGDLPLRGSIVSVAACESGAFDPGYPDEFVGFPSAFLFAGATSVLGSMWPVEDMAGALLMRRYYSSLIHDKCYPGEALCRAQRWLRESTAFELELARLYEDRFAMSRNKDNAAMRAMRFFRDHPQIKPFHDPFFWAGFALYGIDS